MNREAIALECAKIYIQSKYPDAAQVDYENIVKDFHDKYLEAFDIIKENTPKEKVRCYPKSKLGL
ncbi:MAG: hypothetical protein ACLRSH_06540 [Turicibacter sp.]